MDSYHTARVMAAGSVHLRVAIECCVCFRRRLKLGVCMQSDDWTDVYLQCMREVKVHVLGCVCMPTPQCFHA